ncbi:MAG: hypothetical protein NWE95_02490 [Candidatus Bathyarchaeota archaeon]|nr:hypothetical protein [Candidatus Bathyarchaeota archaeon]
MVKEIKKKTPQKHEQTESQSAEYSPEILEQLKKSGIDPDNATLQQLFPPFIDAYGNDLSLMSYTELRIMMTYGKTRRYFLEKYPRSQKEANMQGQPLEEAPNEQYDIDIAKAREDPLSKVFVEALMQAKPIYDKVQVLQQKASEYEKFCLRLYLHLTCDWSYIQDAKEFRGVLLDSDIFEIVEAYFKICKKYKVPTFEEPYYFLSETRRREVKLEGDMLKRSTDYSDNEIRVSILEDFL